MLPPTLIWTGKSLRLLDQTLLPAEEKYIDVTQVVQLEDCIRRLVVRGAPAIGCAAAFGVVLITREVTASLAGKDSGATADKGWWNEFDLRCKKLIATRPTAVNLKWAVERCQKAVHSAVPAKRLETAESEAIAILQEDQQMCRQIGQHGAELLRNQSKIENQKSKILMTHCNAGALATGGCGTALSVIYAARDLGLKIKVFACETRPLLQGARLTAWELSRSGIDVTVICDSMAATVMREHKPDAVIVGADRIAANGDTANKIGTYGLAVLARHHGVPFYIAAPSSTFDLSISDGSKIPIEERSGDEIRQFVGKLSVPPEAKVYNPAFDVTPAELISAHITEKGLWTARIL